MNRALRGLAGAGCGLVVLGLAARSGGTAAGAAQAAGHGVIRVIHVVHVAAGRVGTNHSNNWSGYNIGAAYPGEPLPATFTAVTREWAVPARTQHTKGQAEDS